MSTDNSSGKSTPSDKLEHLRSQGYKIVEFDTDNPGYQRYPAIAYRYRDVIGRGSYGNVYKGYPIDLSTGQLDKERKLALKIFKRIDDVNANEAKFFNSYYDGCELLTSEYDLYMVMSFLPGENIMKNTEDNNRSILNIEINDYGFSKRVDLIANIMMAMNIIHHNTPKTGHALVHGDINGSNIRIHIDPETEKVDVYILDFGLAEEVHDDPKAVWPAKVTGTPLFMSSEIIEQEVHGIKSDIYALTPIFAAILGAVDPFKSRDGIPYYKYDYYKTPYDFTGMFDDYAMPELPFHVRVFVTRFLSRMQNENIALRPDSDEALKFFVTLNKLLLLYGNNPSDNAIYTCAALLAVQADGVAKECTKSAEANTHVAKDFDFEDPNNLQTMKNIIDASQKQILTPQAIRSLLSGNTINFASIRALLFANSRDGSPSPEPLPSMQLKPQ